MCVRVRFKSERGLLFFPRENGKDQKMIILLRKTRNTVVSRAIIVFNRAECPTNKCNVKT